MRVIFAILVLSIFSFGSVWSTSYYNTIKNSVNNKINAKMEIEYNYINNLQQYYEKNILELEKVKEENRKKILKLQNEELLLLKKIENIEKSINNNKAME